MSDKKKVVIFITHCTDDHERATLPFAMANAGLALGSEVVIIAQGDGVEAITKLGISRITAAPFPPLAELADVFFELGGHLISCSPCMESRGINEADLLKGAVVGAAVAVMSEVLTSSAQLIY